MLNGRLEGKKLFLYYKIKIKLINIWKNMWKNVWQGGEKKYISFKIKNCLIKSPF